MNVLVLSCLFPTPVAPYSGIFVLEQLKALRELGVEVVPICPTPWAPRALRFVRRVRECMSVPRETELAGFHVLYPRVIAPGGRFWAGYGCFFYVSLRRLVARLLRQYHIDLIHAHQVLPCGYAASLLSRELNVPVVATMHGSDVRDYPRTGQYIATATRWSLRHVPHHIAVSHEIKAQAQLLEPSVGSVHVIHNGADDTLFCPHSRAKARARLGLPAENRIILFVGSLLSIKGPDILIKAFARLQAQPSGKLLLYLLGDGFQKSEFVALADQLRIASSVRFMGARPYSEIPLWLSAANCLVVPSRGEGLPTILPESMMCRLPIVASAVGGIPEIIEDRQTGRLIRAEDDLGFSNAIQDVVFGDPAEVDAIVNRAEKYAREHLSWHINARRTVAVYRLAMGGSERASCARQLRMPAAGTRSR